jgi:hypothetical protein
MMEQLGSLMQTPQGQALVRVVTIFLYIILLLLKTLPTQMSQALSNPALLRQIMASNPRLAQDPTAQALLSDPSFLQAMADPASIEAMLLGGAGAGDGGGDGAVLVPAAVFNDAMRCLNGGAIPAGYPNPESGDFEGDGDDADMMPGGGDDDGDDGGDEGDEGDDGEGDTEGGPAPAWHEYVTMDALDRALDAALGIATPTHTPLPAGVAAAMAAASSSAAMGAASAAPASAAPQQQQQQQQPYADALATLTSMGFTNRAAWCGGGAGRV